MPPKGKGKGKKSGGEEGEAGATQQKGGKVCV